MEQVAALGIGKARDLGKIFALMLQGKFVNRTLLEKYRNPQIASGLDEVVMAPMAKGHGFYYEAHPKDPVSETAPLYQGVVLNGFVYSLAG